MYAFILNQWIMKVFSQERVQACVTKGYITQEQANTILATAQIS